MTEPALTRTAPNLIGVGAQSVSQNAIRLGLTWRMRPATVATVDSLTSVTIVQDGDTAEIAAVSLVGTVAVGDRVMSILLPPAGVFIIGYLPTFARNALVARIGTITSGPAIGAETADLTTPSFTAVTGRAYRVNYRGLNVSSVANLVTMRIRQNTTGGQLLSTRQQSHANTVGQTYFDSVYFTNTTGADITTTLITSLQASAGTVTATGSASLNRYLEVYEVGSSDSYPDAIAMV
jgi:hypothetical protein